MTVSMLRPRYSRQRPAGWQLVLSLSASVLFGACSPSPAGEERLDLMVNDLGGGPPVTNGSRSYRTAQPKRGLPREAPAPDEITVFLGGDVMTGRGIDQALPHPGDPKLQEVVVRDARRYVGLAERANGPIRRPLDFDYVWGDALQELERTAPDVRVINLETSVTRSDQFWGGKGIHYRMNPANLPVLTAAGIDCCTLANNHVLDWGHSGLADTLEALRQAGIRTAGAGAEIGAAQAPAILAVEGKGRVLVFAFGFPDSGIPAEWAASENRSGVNLLEDFSDETVQRVAQIVAGVKRDGDVAIASIHWGSNWGYQVPDRHRRFAHRLIDSARVDLVHGHSSHHPRGLEVHQGKLILYGAGDLLNDYEGISGYERFRGDLSLMYFAGVRVANGELVRLRMVPLQIRRFRLRRASSRDAKWLRDTLNQASQPFGTTLELNPDDGNLQLRWSTSGAPAKEPPGRAPSESS